MTSRKDVFLVGKVEAVAQTQSDWLVRGRAYEEIHVGDVVYFDVATPKTDNGPISFAIVSIRTYGKDTPLLSGMWTGEIVLRGEYGNLIREHQKLFILA